MHQHTCTCIANHWARHSNGIKEMKIRWTLTLHCMLVHAQCSYVMHVCGGHRNINDAYAFAQRQPSAIYRENMYIMCKRLHTFAWYSLFHYLLLSKLSFLSADHNRSASSHGSPNSSLDSPVYGDSTLVSPNKRINRRYI